MTPLAEIADVGLDWLWDLTAPGTVAPAVWVLAFGWPVFLLTLAWLKGRSAGDGKARVGPWR
jgi:hypothetical protein